MSHFLIAGTQNPGPRNWDSSSNTHNLRPEIQNRRARTKNRGQQSWTKPNITTKKSTFIFPLPTFAPIQYCRVAIVGSLLKNPVSRCASRSQINIEWRDRGDCRNVTLVLSRIVGPEISNQGLGFLLHTVWILLARIISSYGNIHCHDKLKSILIFLNRNLEDFKAFKICFDSTDKEQILL